MPHNCKASNAIRPLPQEDNHEVSLQIATDTRLHQVFQNIDKQFCDRNKVEQEAAAEQRRHFAQWAEGIAPFGAEGIALFDFGLLHPDHGVPDRQPHCGLFGFQLLALPLQSGFSKVLPGTPTSSFGILRQLPQYLPGGPPLR